MDFILFIISIIVISIIGAAMAYVIGYHMFENWMLVIIIILAALGFGLFGASMADEIHAQNNLICGKTNLTIVDTFQEGTLFGDVFLAKLNDGVVVRYGDPFVWKHIKEGDTYPVITIRAHTYLYGNITKIYHYISEAPAVCQIKYMNGELNEN